MKTATSKNDVDHYTTQASKFLAKAVTATRDTGDIEYSIILQKCLHDLERPHWLDGRDDQKSILPALPERLPG